MGTWLQLHRAPVEIEAKVMVGHSWAGKLTAPPLPAPISYPLQSLNVGAAELQVTVSGDHYSAQRHSCRTERPFGWMHVPAA